MTAYVTWAAMLRDVRCMREAMLRQQSAKSEWRESPQLTSSCAAQREAGLPRPDLRRSRGEGTSRAHTVNSIFVLRALAARKMLRQPSI